MAGISTMVIAPYPSALRDEECTNCAPALAEIPHTLAGRARWLEEWTTGGSAVSTEAPLIPKNPQGRYGHDHSGPPYGSCFRHTLFSYSGVNDSTNWTTAQYISIPPENRVHLSATVWVRPFVAIPGAPYSRCYIDYRAVMSAGSANATFYVSGLGAAEVAEIESITSTEAQAQLSTYLEMQPGFNSFIISIKNGSSTDDLRIIALSGSQIVKRSHT